MIHLEVLHFLVTCMHSAAAAADTEEDTQAAGLTLGILLQTEAEQVAVADNLEVLQLHKLQQLV